MGAILGSLLFSIFLGALDWDGACEQLLIAMSLAAALVMLVPALRATLGEVQAGGTWAAVGARGGRDGGGDARPVADHRPLRRSPGAWSPMADVMISYVNEMVPGITKPEDVTVDFGSLNHYCLFVGEGMNVSVAVTEDPAGFRCFHGGGKVQASNHPDDMRLQRMLGHIPALVHPDPKNVLVVACGAGVTAGSFIPHPGSSGSWFATSSRWCRGTWLRSSKSQLRPGGR